RPRAGRRHAPRRGRRAPARRAGRGGGHADCAGDAEEEPLHGPELPQVPAAAGAHREALLFAQPLREPVRGFHFEEDNDPQAYIPGGSRGLLGSAAPSTQGAAPNAPPGSPRADHRDPRAG
ncbi:unnamed protein product, partial [Prorocentrum cordatum]